MIVSRKKIAAKFGNRCAYCGQPLKRNWCREHVKPIVRFRNVRWSFSGRHGCKYPENHTLDNIVPACKECNDSKSSLDIETWRASLKWLPLGQPVIFWFERYKDAST
jgi:5-methylcytosine-specific restriction endonuclease McrA